MKGIGSISEIVDSREVEGVTVQVHTTADARYREDQRLVEVDLRASLVRVNPRGRDDVSGAPWLPPAQTVFESADMGEAGEVLRAVFKSWIGKVRKSMPADHDPVSWGCVPPASSP